VNDDDGQTRTDIHALSGIRTHGLSIQAIEYYSLELAAKRDRITRLGLALFCLISSLSSIKLLRSVSQMSGSLRDSTSTWVNAFSVRIL
jgi:hypothetical protein